MVRMKEKEPGFLLFGSAGGEGGRGKWSSRWLKLSILWCPSLKVGRVSFSVDAEL